VRTRHCATNGMMRSRRSPRISKPRWRVLPDTISQIWLKAYRPEIYNTPPYDIHVMRGFCRRCRVGVAGAVAASVARRRVTPRAWASSPYVIHRPWLVVACVVARVIHAPCRLCRDVTRRAPTAPLRAAPRAKMRGLQGARFCPGPQPACQLAEQPGRLSLGSRGSDFQASTQLCTFLSLTGRLASASLA
jgi:hypothetical protein